MRPKELRGVGTSLRRILVRVRPHLQRRRRAIGLATFALFAEVALRLLEPWPLKFIFDLVTGYGPAEAGGLSPGAWSSDAVTLLILSAVAIPIVTGLRALAAYWNTVGFALVGNRVLTDLRAELYRHLQSLSLTFHTRARSGDLIVRVIGDVGLLRDATVTALLPLVAHSTVLVGMLAVMFWLHWKLTVAALVVAPGFWLITRSLTRRIHTVSRKQRRRESAMATTAAESIGAIRVVQSLSLEESFASTFSAKNEEGFKEGVQGRRLAARLERTVDFLVAIGTAVVVGYGARLVMTNQLTPGDLIVVITYLRRVFRPVKDFAKYTARLAKASAAGERVLEVLDRDVEIQDAPDARAAPRFRGAIGFEDVSYAYEPDHPILRGLSVEIAPGQSVAVVGSIGAGKSTLAGLILRLHDPSSGRVLIDGEDIRGFTIASVRRQISVVLQEPVLFAGTVRENIAYGKEGSSEEEIERAVRLVGAEALIAGLPDGYETSIGERGVTLSSGQRQLIAACRAAVRQAPILILDEPTSSLDEENARMVDDALRRLSRGCTTVLITHDLDRAAEADCILHLGEGRVLEKGSHEELLAAGGPYARLYRKKGRNLTLVGDEGKTGAVEG